MGKEFESLQSELFQKLPTGTLAPTPGSRSSIAEEALYLHSIGLNVFPQPYALKGGWPWKFLQFSRLQDYDLAYLIEHAIRCNVAVMMGRTSENLFVIDCEDNTTFKAQCAKVRAAGIPLWAVESARGGHIYLRSRDGEVNNLAEKKAVELGIEHLEVRGNRCYVMAPPSVHPDGTVYKWISREGDTIPIVTLDQIDWIPLSLTKTNTTSKNAYRSAYEIMREQVETVAAASEGTRNTALNRAAFVLGMQIGSGRLDRHVVEVALEEACHKNYYIEDHSIINFSRVIASALDAGEENADPSDTPDIVVHTSKAVQWINAYSFPGRTGTSDRAVALAFLERAKKTPYTVFRASVRELSEIAQVSINTVRSSTKRLIEAGFISYVSGDTSSKASLYRLECEIDTLDLTCSNSVSNSHSKTVISHSGHDLWERGGVGKTGEIVYYGLLKFRLPVTPTQLADSLGCSVDKVKYGLKVLSQKTPQLVEHLRDGWIAYNVGDRALDELARQLGVLGKGKARHIKYERDRSYRTFKVLLEYVDQSHRMYFQPDEVDTSQALYCQNCGQAQTVFDGVGKDLTCQTCVDDLGWDRRSKTMWDVVPPESPPFKARGRQASATV